MSNEKLRIANTDLDNLVGNLRGEVGEVITSWVVMRQFLARGQSLSTDDLARDTENRQLAFVHLMTDKVRDELVGRLSELAEKKIGQLTFYFAAKKLGALEAEVDSFERYIAKTRIRAKRNLDVSHKQLPEKMTDRQHIHIPYPVLLRAVAMALRLMKQIDRRVLGPSAKYCWHEARTRRYDYMSPPRVGYLLLPYLNLSGEARLRVLREELSEGTAQWSEMPTVIDGQPATILACQKWGIIQLGDCLLPLPQYPLQHLQSIDTNPTRTSSADNPKADTARPAR